MIAARSVTWWACASSCLFHIVAVWILNKPAEKIPEIDLVPVELLMPNQANRTVSEPPPAGSRQTLVRQASPSAPIPADISSSAQQRDDSPKRTGSDAAGAGNPAQSAAETRVVERPLHQPAAFSGTRAEYLSVVRSSIERKREYPSHARQLRLEGVVVVGFRIVASGSIDAIRIVSSSGHQFLDTAAERAVRAAAPFATPVSYGLSDGVMVEVPIVYRLKNK